MFMSRLVEIVFERVIDFIERYVLDFFVIFVGIKKDKFFKLDVDLIMKEVNVLEIGQVFQEYCDEDVLWDLRRKVFWKK